MRTIKSGTSQPFALVRLSDGEPKTDVTHSTVGLAIKYKIGNATPVTLTPVSMSAGSYASGGIYHAGNGAYMIGLPVAIVATASFATILVWVELADVECVDDEIQVVAYDATQVAVGANTTTPPTTASIATAVWANATRTLSSISDSAGITTLLSRITGLLPTKAQADAAQAAIESHLPETGRAVTREQIDATPISVNTDSITVTTKTQRGAY